VKLEFKCSRCGQVKKAETYQDNTGIFVPCDCDARAIELEHRQAVERRKEARRVANRRR